MVCYNFATVLKLLFYGNSKYIRFPKTPLPPSKRLSLESHPLENRVLAYEALLHHLLNKDDFIMKYLQKILIVIYSVRFFLLPVNVL
jgi:hypothetical protein